LRAVLSVTSALELAVLAGPQMTIRRTAVEGFRLTAPAR